MAKGNIGTVVQVIGPVLDIRFKDGELPQLLNAVEVERREKLRLRWLSTSATMWFAASP